MKKYCLAFLIVILNSIFFKAQEKKELLVSRSIVDSIVKNNVEFSDKDLLAYSVNDEFFIIILNDKKLTKYFIEMKKLAFEKKQISIKKIKQPLIDIFKNGCSFNEIDFSSPEYKDFKLANGNKNYFVIKKNGMNFCEFQLSIILNPIPINKILYGRLNKYIIESRKLEQ